jgi:hypothetical protein
VQHVLSTQSHPNSATQNAWMDLGTRLPEQQLKKLQLEQLMGMVLS